MIQLDGVSVNFAGKSKQRVEAVKGVSLRIAQGEIFGIVGSSGAGKSTLLRTINLLERPTDGRVMLDQADITDLKGKPLREVRRRIGMIFQHFNLINTKSVYQNIKFAMQAAGKPDQEIKERIPQLLELVGLVEKARVYPVQLSGGQKQRVAIARALANQPDILLCDEPTSALDPETTQSILELLRAINRQFGITIVIITHEMDVVKRICDRVAVMHGGEIVETGPVYDIFVHPANALTRQWVQHTLDFTLPPWLMETYQGTVIKLVFRGPDAQTPVLSDATHIFGLKLNILHGKIEYIGEKPLGILVVGVIAPADAIGSLLTYLKERTDGLEVLHESA